MEIRWSQNRTDGATTIYVESAAAGVRPDIGRCSPAGARFTLDTDEAGHDRVIRALLTLDPDATIRTARAVYEGLEDFEKQRGKA